MLFTFILTLIAVIFSYLLGSLSTAIIVCRLAGLPDPRTEGSKNPGATNVLRLGGKKLAAVTLLFDALKGFIPVALTLAITPSPWIVGLVMVAVFLGHLYPIWFNFEGGKGVATAIGIIFALSWVVGVMVLASWGLMAWLFKISSLAALTSLLLAPLYIAAWLKLEYAVPVIMLTAFIFWRHCGNIKRILNGIEPKIGQKLVNKP